MNEFETRRMLAGARFDGCRCPERHAEEWRGHTLYACGCPALEPTRHAESAAPDVPISIWAKRGGAFVHSRLPYSTAQLRSALTAWAIDERDRFKREDVRSPDKGTYGYRASLLEAVADLLDAEHNDGDNNR